MSTLIGWDKIHYVGSVGIFGISEAYGVTVEEYGRKTLHTHIHIWIKEINTVRNLLYHENSKVRRITKKKNDIVY